jgi:putative acetyltransferase
MIIRKGQLEDLAELQFLFVETIKSVCKTDYNSEQIEVWTYSIKNKERWNEIMTNQLVLVAQIENKIVGFTSLAYENYIDLLYVHKDYQRQGIAHKLYTNIEDIAKRQGQTTLKSDVSKTAKPFFERVGFEVINEQIIVRQEVELTNFKMTKTLAQQ